MRSSLLLTIFFTVWGISAVAQTADLSFRAPLPLRAAGIASMLSEPNGDIVVAGDIDYVGAWHAEPIIRIHANGTYDDSFTFSYTPGFSVRGMVRAKNDDILALLWKYDSGAVYYTNMRLVQISSVGAIVRDVPAPDNTSMLAVQADGKILLTGYTLYGATYAPLTRYHTDLTEDTAFRQSVSVAGTISCIAVWNDKILVAGRYNRVNGVERNDLVRLNANGSIDETFDAGTGITDNCEIRSLTVLPDGRIVTSGFVDHYNDEYARSGVVRLNPDGSRDDTFSPSSLRNGSGTTVATADGLYVTAFADVADTTQTYLLRLREDGELDESFEPVLIDPFGEYAVSIMAIDNHVVISSMTRVGNGFGVAKISKTGVRDDTFQPEIARVGTVRTGASKDGKIVVLGDFARIGGHDTYGLARLESNGTVDKTFQMKEHRGTGRQVLLQDDGNLLVLMDNDFFQLDSSGDLVPTFRWKRGIERLYQIDKFIVLPNGKIMAADANVLARLNVDGTRDASFVSPSLDIVSSAVDFDIQGDKIIYGSAFRTINGVEANQVARITSEAALDHTFSVGRGPESSSEASWTSIFMIKVLDDQSILVGGTMDRFDGTAIRQGLLKLSADGKVDSVFAANQYNARPIGWSVLFDAVSVQVGPRVFILGDNDLYVVNTDGTTDPQFQLPPVVEEITGFIALHDATASGRVAANENTSLLLFGTFKGANGTVPLLKINVPPAVIMGTTPSAADKALSVRVYPQPASTNLSMRVDGERGRYTARVYDMTGQTRLQATIQNDNQEAAVDISPLAAGTYVLHVTSPSGKVGMIKFVRAR